MLVFTRAQTVVVWPQGGAGKVLRGEGDVVVNVLAPLHQQLGVDFVRSLYGAPEYFLADFPRLSTGIKSVSSDVRGQTTETINSGSQLMLASLSFPATPMPEWPTVAI